MYSNITVGCDPELFILNKQNKLVASCGLIGGTKEAPRFITDRGHMVQEDNVSVEFGIPPAHSVEEFIHDICFVINYLEEFLGERDLILSCTASAVFPKEQLLDRRALVFGCEPDFNAWTAKVNPRPRAKNKALRSCGGHVHVGFDSPNMETVERLMQTLDLFLGVPSVLYDEDTARRELYGKAGSFRYKPYGGEYRTLSNWWVAKPEYMGYVYDQVQDAVSFLNSGNTIKEDSFDQIKEAINMSNKQLASDLIQQYGVNTL